MAMTTATVRRPKLGLLYLLGSCLLVYALPAQLPQQGRSQRIPIPKPQAPEAPANPFWTHPYGDDNSVPCVHRSQQHPGGDPRPCLCPPVAQHPGGDPKTVPCVHRSQQHPGGDDTGGKAPCRHFKNGRPEHPGGDPVMVPCVHWTAQHPGGDTTTVPCVHLSPKHPNGEPGATVPCVHMVAQHQNGDLVKVPCAHPLEKKRHADDPGIDFYTDDAQVQQDLLAAVAKLKGMGVQFRWPRALSVFYREPIQGNPDDNNDPFWSHYDPVQNALVITKDPVGYGPMPPLRGTALANWRQQRLTDRRYTVGHEFGHALVGNSCVWIATPGGPHAIMDERDPGLAMSEGWGHFVSMVIHDDRNAPNANYKTWNIEQGHTTTGGAFTEKVEFRVACMLWDLYDTDNEPGDPASFEFRDLFAVFSPTLQTLAKGPLFQTFEGYSKRLEKNVGRKAEIDAVRQHNLTPGR